MEQIIKLEGRIAEVMPEQSGVSQRTGNSWKSQEFLFEYYAWSGQNYASRICVKVFGEENLRRFNLQQYDEVILTLTIRANKSQDGSRWFNEITVANVEHKTKGDAIDKAAAEVDESGNPKPF